MHISHLKKLTLCLLTLPLTVAYAADYQSDDGTVSFTVSCGANGAVKAKLLDTMKPRNLMITSLNYLPMVAPIGLMNDLHKKGYTPFDEILNLESFDYRDLSFGKKNGTIKINKTKLNEYVSLCESEYLSEEKKKEIFKQKILKEKKEKERLAIEKKEQLELQSVKENQLSKVKARKARKVSLENKEKRLLVQNPSFRYQGKVEVNDIANNNGVFVTVNLSSYQLQLQLSESTYLFTHISNLKAFPNVILTSNKFYREGLNGPFYIDVIHYGNSVAKNGQVIRLEEVE